MPARLPTVRLQMSGTLAAHPGRYSDRANEPRPAPGLGEPPVHFDAVHRKVWRELSRSMPEGVFTVADRFMAAQACRLIVKHNNDTITDAQNVHLTNILGRFGGSPVDRSKVNAPAANKPKQNDWSFKQVRSAGTPVRPTDNQWPDSGLQVDTTGVSTIPN